MALEGDEVHVETDEARGGSTPHIVRWVLGISLVAAIVLLSAVWMFGALSEREVGREIDSRSIARDGDAAASEPSDTDGIVLEGTDEIADATGEADPLLIANEAEAPGDAP